MTMRWWRWSCYFAISRVNASGRRALITTVSRIVAGCASRWWCLTINTFGSLIRRRSRIRRRRCCGRCDCRSASHRATRATATTVLGSLMRRMTGVTVACRQLMLMRLLTHRYAMSRGWRCRSTTVNICRWTFTSYTGQMTVYVISLANTACNTSDTVNILGALLKLILHVLIGTVVILGWWNDYLYHGCRTTWLMMIVMMIMMIMDRFARRCRPKIVIVVIQGVQSYRIQTLGWLQWTGFRYYQTIPRTRC